ncbi:hypothetical protein MNEG_9944 [Monoraphidium neglectum]|uniref:Apyrase n=1 Tax=Monoraphidium neglectum TaxID=145388 RepID=A0A0D2KR07_9CHLO|nr:hypothetical protein MNEG_9944 [Monoraphidium neglectum]KIY98018.1 hypothetical protein MNEG_9944 [Monoraphidium neglectum]|eukprot:XP_013897038.1 hypothetical protein MNEG_9944 [Monoraphidium neglectum]
MKHGQIKVQQLQKLCRQSPRQATLLFLALAVLPARTVNTRAKGATAASLPPGARQSTSNNSGAGLPGRVVYSVVIDAGSTGSRVHVFRFKQDRRTRSLRLLGELFLPTHPGLSSFSGDPRAAALSLKPLMGAAVKAVPPDLRPATALTLRATAGLRLLPAAKADAVLREAFALPPAQARAAPAGSTTSVLVQDQTFDIYVHSYLGFGLMAARAALIVADRNATDHTHGCFAKGVRLNYTYNGRAYPLEEVVDLASFDRCEAAAMRAMNTSKCNYKEACSFNGVWRAKRASMQMVYYVSSFFWDRAVDVGIIKDAHAIDWATTPGVFKTYAEAVCALTPAQLLKKYGVADDLAPWLCADMSFLYTVLAKGLKLPDERRITLVRRMLYDGMEVSTSWALGLAINALSLLKDNGSAAAATYPAAAAKSLIRGAKAADKEALVTGGAGSELGLPRRLMQLRLLLGGPGLRQSVN